MGKKGSRKKKNYYKAEAEGPSYDEANESSQAANAKVDEISHLPFEQKKAAIRQLLIETGTDVVQNDNDPTGDGDQSIIETFDKRDLARHLFAFGGDIADHISPFNPLISRLALACATGAHDVAQTELKRVKTGLAQPYSRSSELLLLLETRVTSMRLSPLLLIVSAGKNVVGTGQKFQDVAKLLLRNGASPMAKDVVGKTVVHYGGGAFATEMTLEVTDMCIRAAKSHHLYSKEVKLHGLNAKDMNDKVGIVGGFDADTDRRAIYLTEDKKEIWIKVENMTLLDKDSSCKSYPLLSEIQDRMGTISLHELCMSSPVVRGVSENHNAGLLLLKKHNTSIYIEDMDGITPFKLCSSLGQMIGANHIAKLVMEIATERGRETTQSRKKKEYKICAQCKVELVKNPLQCSRCKMISYCSKECQVANWPKHKLKCKDLASAAVGIKLDPPTAARSQLHTAAVSFQLGGRVFSGGKFQKPKDVKFNEQFVIKCQGNSNKCPIMIYDQSRVCMFEIEPGQKGFKEVLAEIHSEPAWQGRKTFMKASFDANGCCTVYPATAGVKAHYNW